MMPNHVRPLNPIFIAGDLPGLGQVESLLCVISHPKRQQDHYNNTDGGADESEFTVITFAQSGCFRRRVIFHLLQKFIYHVGVSTSPVRRLRALGRLQLLD